MNLLPNKTIVFITGAFVSHNCWKSWTSFYTSKGYNCIAPPWPYKDATAEELRNQQPNDTELADLKFKELVQHYTDIVTALPEKPIVIGHSIGGLIVQLLVNRDLVAAGVALHSVPPQGVFTLEWSSIKTVWKPMGFFSSSKKTYLMSPEEWKYAFTNGVQSQEQMQTYEEFVVPESKRVLRGTLKSEAKIDFKKQHPPLLLLSGSEDKTIPASFNYENYIRYDKNRSVTDYKEFEGKNHFSIGLPSWHDEADYILSWIAVLGM